MTLLFIGRNSEDLRLSEHEEVRKERSISTIVLVKWTHIGLSPASRLWKLHYSSKNGAVEHHLPIFFLTALFEQTDGCTRHRQLQIFYHRVPRQHISIRFLCQKYKYLKPITSTCLLYVLYT